MTNYELCAEIRMNYPDLAHRLITTLSASHEYFNYHVLTNDLPPEVRESFVSPGSLTYINALIWDYIKNNTDMIRFWLLL